MCDFCKIKSKFKVVGQLIDADLVDGEVEFFIVPIVELWGTYFEVPNKRRKKIFKKGKKIRTNPLKLMKIEDEEELKNFLF